MERLTRLARKVEHEVTRGVNTFFTTLLGIPSTSREADAYREDLFPEYPDNEAMFEHLRGKCVVDIGSGLTHKKSGSVINRIAETGDEQTLFMGIDPNVGGVQGVKPVDWYNRMRENMLDRGSGALPGARFAVRGEMPGIPFPENTVDIFLSDGAVGLWVNNPRTLLSMFEDMEHALVEGGEIRLALANRVHFVQNDDLGKFIREHFSISEGSNPIIFTKLKHEL